jgi:DNA-binding GntR family transcriptional regulator
MSETPAVTRRRTSKLADQLALGIEGLVTSGEVRAGDPLVERTLAERFSVSRSPIRQALRLLQQKGLLVEREDGGYNVAHSVRGPAIQVLASLADDLSAEESIYLKLAEDRLEGRLPDRLSESDLMRRYALTKAQLAALLQRIVQEGWIERLPGHGWRFLPILTSPETYDQGYRFRILIESAALSEPGFRVDEAALKKCLAEQQALIDGAVEWASPAQLFDANTRLHETIAAFSGNVFIIESLKRINRLRRLMEYKKVVGREAAARRCREHRVLIELLLTGQREAAADFIRLHLRDAAREKSAS